MLMWLWIHYMVQLQGFVDQHEQAGLHQERAWDELEEVIWSIKNLSVLSKIVIQRRTR